MKKSGNTILALILLTLLCGVSAARAELSASLDRYTVSMGETVRLTISSDGDADPGDADLERLKQDFDILQRSSSVSTQIINGQRTQRRDLVLEITPRREGSFVIPPFSVDGERSAALSVAVRPEPQMSAGEEIVLFEAELDRDSVYVQGQLLLTLRVQQAVNLESRSVTELQIDGAYVKTLAQNSFQRTVDGRPWLVHEIRYAIFPESSGELVIPAQTFSGRLSNGRRSLFDTRPAGRLIRRNTEALRVEVLPRPDAATDPVWLPAADLDIEEQWSAPLDSLKVGDSITRSITVTGKGLQGAQLPPISLEAADGLRVYPDQPVINDVEDEGGVTGIRTDSLALVAVRPGVYDLPPVTLSWWDTEADRQRQVRLPGRQLRVSPGAAAIGAVTPDPTLKPAASEARPMAAPASPAWLPWLTAALGVGWLATALGWIFSGRRRGPSAPVSAQSPQASPKAVVDACRRNDATEAQRALRAWLNASGHHGPLHAWEGAAEREAYVDALDGMERALYAPQVGNWDGAALAAVVQAASGSGTKKSRAGEDSALPPLYPTG